MAAPTLTIGDKVKEIVYQAERYVSHYYLYAVANGAVLLGIVESHVTALEAGLYVLFANVGASILKKIKAAL